MTFRSSLKRLLSSFGLDSGNLIARIGRWSLWAALRQQGRSGMVDRLRQIVPDISAQESRPVVTSTYMEIKRRALHTMQCALMLDAIRDLPAPTVIDIGDSAGTHMRYLCALAAERLGKSIETISVNLDERAIEKIRAQGLRAIHCRAEDVTSDQIMNRAGLLTSFQMVEHLHNPALFFRRLAVKSPCNLMVISVPYLRHSRVGLHHIRHDVPGPQFAEDVHIFELSPQDWRLLLLHSGWRVTRSEIHFQYPRGWPVISPLLALFWRYTDFEGFWCAVLERDRTDSDVYMDWEE